MSYQLNVGDAVTIFRGGFGPPQIEKSEVVEVTKGGNYKFRGSDYVWNQRGSYRGASSWSNTYFEPFDQKKWDEISKDHRERTERNILRQTNFANLPIDAVREILAIIAKAEGK